MKRPEFRQSCSLAGSLIDTLARPLLLAHDLIFHALVAPVGTHVAPVGTLVAPVGTLVAAPVQMLRSALKVSVCLIAACAVARTRLECFRLCVRRCACAGVRALVCKRWAFVELDEAEHATANEVLAMRGFKVKLPLIALSLTCPSACCSHQQEAVRASRNTHAMIRQIALFAGIAMQPECKQLSMWVESKSSEMPRLRHESLLFTSMHFCSEMPFAAFCYCPYHLRLTFWARALVSAYSFAWSERRRHFEPVDFASWDSVRDE
eukprot:3506587-Pleurochrysis_carterae.AAC.3